MAKKTPCEKCGKPISPYVFINLNRQFNKFFSALDMGKHHEYPPNICKKCFAQLVRRVFQFNRKPKV